MFFQFLVTLLKTLCYFQYTLKMFSYKIKIKKLNIVLYILEIGILNTQISVSNHCVPPHDVELSLNSTWMVKYLHRNYCKKFFSFLLTVWTIPQKYQSFNRTITMTFSADAQCILSFSFFRDNTQRVVTSKV